MRNDKKTKAQLADTVKQLRKQVAELESSVTDLRQTEKKYRLNSTAVEQCTVGIAVADLGGNLLSLNRAFAALHGYTPQEMVGKHLSIFHTPEQMPAVQEANRQIQETGSFDGEIWHVRRDGSVFPAVMHNTLLRDDSDEPVGMIGTLRDVSEQKQAEETLRKSEESLRALISGMGNGFTLHEVICNDDGVPVDCRFLAVNRAFEELVGLSADDVIGKTVLEVLPRTESYWIDTLGEVALTGESVHFENYAQNLDKYYEVMAYSPERGQFAAVFTDITERRQAEQALRESEERFREVAEHMREAFWIFEMPQGNLAYVNSAFEEIWGLSREEFYKNPTSYYDTICPEFSDEVRSALEKQLRGEYTNTEYQIARPDGSVRWIRDRTFPIVNEAGEVRWFAGIADDITAYKQAAKQRDLLQERAQYAQKLESLGVLAGGIAHDFNNLLMTILGNADLALENLSEVAPARPCIEEVERAARRAAGLTHQMLAYSGRGHFIKQSVDLSEAVGEMTHLLKTSVSRKAILNLNLQPGLPRIEVDVSQIHQLLIGLTTNASEAIGSKSGVITVSTRDQACGLEYLRQSRLPDIPPEGDYVCLEVADTGCGMDEETQDNLFDPFFTTKFPGRGLGMAAVFGIVRGHRGAILVESAPDEGSTIRVLFPVSEASETATGAQEAKTVEWRGAGTVLLVDDEEAVRSVSQRMLERLGFTVLTATDGREAVALFRARADEIACVLLDLTMPRMDGEEALRELRRIRDGVRVILSSGYSEHDLSDRFAGKGLAGIIQKPYSLSELREKLRATFGEGDSTP